MGFEPHGPPALRIVLCRMLPTINLDHEGVVGTNEIGDEGSERNLATEFESAQLAVAEARP